MDGGGKAILALTQQWPASSAIQQDLTFTFPASGTPYTMVGVQAEVVPKGTGFTTSQPLHLDYLLNPPLQVPSGLTVNAVVYLPLSGLGSITVTLGPDQTPPGPSTLAVTPSQTSAVVNWTAATDNVGVTGYILERATGTVSFAPIATTTALTFADSGLTLATVYSYRVKATDSAGNQGPYSNVVTVTTLAPPSPAGIASPVGSCTAPAALAGCSTPLPQIVDSSGTTFSLKAGVPQVNGKPTSNVYSPGITYLYVVSGPNIRTHNSNGTYCQWSGTVWAGC